MPPKRKRAQADDEDDEAGLLGNQALPIANLPHDFCGEPEDGMQYLFLVRRDAKALPNTTRVLNPYETANVQDHAMSTPVKKPPHPCIPSEEWKVEFEKSFRAFRETWKIHTSKASPSHSSKPDLDLPKPKDRDGWLAYIDGVNSAAKGKEKETYGPSTAFTPRSVAIPSGRPANIQTAGIIDDDEPKSESESEEELGPRLPTPSILRSLDDHGTVHLLMFIAHWIRRSLDYAPPPKPRPAHFPKHHQQWTFSLLAHLDTGLRSEEISHLRELARACIAVVKADLESEGPAIVDQDVVGGSGAGNSKGGGERKYIHLTGAWMIIAAIASIWGQRDMWQNTEEALADLVLVKPRKVPKVEAKKPKMETDRPDVDADVVLNYG
ncbi:survival motor neuron interacting protein 1-domain-containing protein [Rhizoctonia solani]|nr:survival motor neuron interacting protein 1-domain-containing protein [Rhizoctonia solani]